MLVPAVLKALLSIKRPHGGIGEELAREIVTDFLKEIHQEYTEDGCGNLRVLVGEADGCVFAAHLDTVHRQDGQIQLGYIEESGELVADDAVTGKPCVLGADDAAGVFLLTEMIKHKVPGQYLFFVGEERGGIGSSQFVKDNPGFSANFVVSFDRKGKSDIITHQGGYRTASDAFATALGMQLYKVSGARLSLKPCTGGVYTDSKEFEHLVPECTNISVGYWEEHTPQESLELHYLMTLRDAVLRVKWQDLPIERNPREYCGMDWKSFYEDDTPGYTLEDLKRAHRWCRGRIDDGELDVQDVEHLLSILENFI